MSLTEQQQRALEHARHVLDEAPAAADTALLAEWYQAVRRALADVAAAFADDGGTP